MRPSRSYWQDAWARLKANRRAIASLNIIIFLMLFTFVGPLIWRVAGTATGASVARSTPYILTLLNLTDWPRFETVKAAKLWCQQQNTALTD